MSETVESLPERESLQQRVTHFLPRGNMLTDAEWTRRHHLLLWVLGVHIPLLALVGLVNGWSLLTVMVIDLGVAAVVAGAAFVRARRAASWLVTLGLTSCSVALVVLSNGSIEAHFHFFIIVGFLALYQDWFPFLWNIAFTVLSHGIGSALAPGLIFNHVSGQGTAWVWALIHGVSVLAACAGVLVFWRFTEDLQEQKTELAQQLAQAEVRRKEFTSDLLLNLARRNQSMFHRQLDIINDLEEKERDPDVLAELFRLDHLATRVRRNAESLLVLSGEQPPRVWSAPVPLRDVVRAAIAETEDLERISFTVDEGLAVVGSTVADVTHLLAELFENAVRYSPPTSAVTVQNRPYHPEPGAQLLIIEDTGVGMPPQEMARANQLLAAPQEVDVSASRRLGFQVVSRLAERHGIRVSLTPTPGCGLTAVLILPAALFPTPTVSAPRRSAPSSLPAPPADMVPAGRAAPGVAEPARSNGRHAWPGAPRREVAEAAGLAQNGHSSNGHQGNGHSSNGHSSNGHSSNGHSSNGHQGNGHQGDVQHRLQPPGDTAWPAGLPRGLIHPIIVPPPRQIDDGASPDAHDPASAAPAPRTSSEGSTPRRTLTRRVPQTHLAPELARPTAPHPAPEHTVPGPSPESAPDTGPMTALSRYQASRRMAHQEIDDAEDVERAGGPDENGARS